MDANVAGGRGRRGERGFTLLEILAVVVIIGILAAFVAPSVFNRIAGAQRTAAKAQLKTLSLALELFRTDTGQYPGTEQGLSALRQQPAYGAEGWNGPYLEEDLPKDPWGRDYQYVCPGIHNPDKYDLFSYGRDGRPGGEGEDADVGNW
ncbi:MAG TPA: type II secretion system major pseudopilin GspG [Firmicutes bacterium]|nr:type II secretion system major pseudopilin GspG [Bacillota bacterium]